VLSSCEDLRRADSGRPVRYIRRPGPEDRGTRYDADEADEAFVLEHQHTASAAAADPDTDPGDPGGSAAAASAVLTLNVFENLVEDLEREAFLTEARQPVMEERREVEKARAASLGRAALLLQRAASHVAPGSSMDATAVRLGAEEVLSKALLSVQASTPSPSHATSTATAASATGGEGEDGSSRVEPACCICNGMDSAAVDSPIVTCSGCGMSCHTQCYGVRRRSRGGSWLCAACRRGVSPPCCLCLRRGGALKPTDQARRWAHVVCGEWLPEVRVGGGHCV
jgi:hypothetical protein